MNKQQLIKRFNAASTKLNSLEVDGNGIFDLLPEDYSGDVTIEDVEFMEGHYGDMKERYKELKIGVFAE
jgi:hypothetical protein